MPEADLLVSVDMMGLRAAPIYPELEAMFEEGEKASDPLTSATARWQELAAAAGIRAENEAELLLAADLDPLDTENPDFNTLDLVGAVRLLSPLGPAALQETILGSEAAAAGQIVVSELEEGGCPVTVVEVREAGETLRLHIAHAEEGRLLFFGSEMGVGGALARRSRGGKGGGLEGELAGARDVLPEGAQVRVLLVLPDTARREFEERARQAREGQTQDPSAMMLLPALEALTGLKTVSLGVVAGDALDVALVGRLGTPEQASQLKTVLDGFLGFGQMMLMAGTGGEAAGFLETLKIETVESDMTLGFRLTGADLEMLREMGKEQ
jgi:hypothetical protein